MNSIIVVIGISLNSVQGNVLGEMGRDGKFNSSSWERNDREWWMKMEVVHDHLKCLFSTCRWFFPFHSSDRLAFLNCKLIFDF